MLGIIDDCHVLVTAQEDEVIYLRASLAGFTPENTIAIQQPFPGQGKADARQPQVILSLVEAYYEVAVTKRLSISNVELKDALKRDSESISLHLWTLFSRYGFLQ